MISKQMKPLYFISEKNIVGPADIPSGKSGDFEIENYVLEYDIYPGGFQSFDKMLSGERFVSLKEKGKVWMSNTPAEIRSNTLYHIHRNDRRILIGGLGLGLNLNELLTSLHCWQTFGDDKILFERITVIEKSEDVINLVAPTYLKALPCLEIIHEDVYNLPMSFKKDRKNFYDKAYIDIWQEISTDTLKEMSSIKAKCRCVMKPGRNRIKCWAEEELKYAKRTGTRAVW